MFFALIILSVVSGAVFLLRQTAATMVKRNEEVWDMNDNSSTIRELLTHPKVQGLVSPDDVKKIAESLGNSEQVSKNLIYIRILFRHWGVVFRCIPNLISYIF